MLEEELLKARREASEMWDRWIGSLVHLQLLEKRAGLQQEGLPRGLFRLVLSEEDFEEYKTSLGTH